MIQYDRITADWINTVSSETRSPDKILIEKAIRALLLLEGLARQELSFVFKGGTALMLHLRSTKRLSIDIDIVLYKDVDDLDAMLDTVAKEQSWPIETALE